MNNRSDHQTFYSYVRPLASSTFIRNEKEKPYGDRRERNKFVEYDAFKEGIVKEKIRFWDEQSRKFAEKHGFVDIPRKKIVKKNFKLVTSGIYSCSGPHPGFHFISSETITSTGSSDFLTTSSRITSIYPPSSESGIESNQKQLVDEDAVKFNEKAKTHTKSFRDPGSIDCISTSSRMTSISPPSSESGIESNEEQHVNEDAVTFNEKDKSHTKSFRDPGSSDCISTSNRMTSISPPLSESGIDSNEEQHFDEAAVKFDEKVKSHTKSFRDIGVNTSYQKQQIIKDYAETEESTGSTNDVLDWNDLVAFKEEIFQMNADFMAEVGDQGPTEVQPTRNLLSRIYGNVTMYTREIVIFYVFFRIATIILLLFC